VSNFSWAHGGGPLACFADGYGSELSGLGFTHNSVVTHVVLMGQLSRWMSEVGIVVGDLTEGRVERFFDSRRARGQRRVPTARTLAPLFVYLRSQGVVTPPEAVAATPLEDLLACYRRHLVDDRGLAPSTVTGLEEREPGCSCQSGCRPGAAGPESKACVQAMSPGICSASVPGLGLGRPRTG
jgi:hypothetical protein